MSGWETLVAALGGLSVGVGLGILLGRRGEDRLRLHVASMERRVRTTLVPILQSRAGALGLPTKPRESGRGDAVEIAFELGESVLRAEERQALPFSDTVEFSAGAHVAPAPNAKTLTGREASNPSSSEHDGDNIE